jgi:hypothetical protein
LGEHVADALLQKKQGKKPAYVGTPGVCPDCHGNLLEIREDGIYCPQCLTKASVNIIDGKLTVDFTPEDLAKNRWSPWGQELHDNNIRKGHAKAAQAKDIIAERLKKYTDYERAVNLPEPVKE